MLMKNSMDPDHQKPADLDLHCFLSAVYNSEKNSSTQCPY